jgi:hypothetical protein
MKGLICWIYRPSPHDFSNRGLSSRVTEVTLVGPVIDGPFEPSPDRPAVTLHKRKVWLDRPEHLYCRSSTPATAASRLSTLSRFTTESKNERRTTMIKCDGLHVTAEGLPPISYANHPTDNSAIMIKRGICGYFAVPHIKPEEVVKANELIGVTPAQAEAMITGSAFGWHVPAADPAHYNEDGTFKKEVL